jgi:hypothetical protein
MKRLAWGVVVVAVLAVGAGALANLGAPQLAGHTATAAQSAAAGHSPLAVRFPLAVRPTRAASAQRQATGMPAPRPHRIVTTAAYRAATRHAPVLDMRRMVGHVAAATVQVVDPATVSLPPTGPVLLLNPNTAAPGAIINVLGSGFDPGKLITLSLTAGSASRAGTARHHRLNAAAAPPSQIIVDTAQAGRDGTFGKNITLPSSLSGHAFSITAQERKGAARAVAHGTIATGSPTATLSTAVGKPGDTVYASARGFDPTEAVDVFLNNLGTAPVTTLHADGSGGLSLAPIPVPYGAVGPTALLLLGRHSHGLAAVPFEMLGLYPTASVSSYAAVADTVLSFSASGFGPSEDVDVRVNTPDGFAVGKLHTDSAGTVRNGGHFRIPFSLKGRNAFVLTGEESHTSTTVSFTVQPYQPIAAPSSYGGGPGTAITFYGTGFARHETVRLWVSRPGGGRTALAQTLRTDARGNLIARPGLYLIGTDAQPGKLVFTLAGDKSATPVTAAFNVQAADNSVALGTAGATGGQ